MTSDSASYKRSQTFFAMLIDDIEDPKFSAVMGLLRDKVIAPNMVFVGWPQTNARSVGKPKPGSLGLLLWDLQPLFLPNCMDLVSADIEALQLQHRGDCLVAVPSILGGELNDARAHACTIGVNDLLISLGCAKLSNHPAGQTFGDPQLANRMLNSLTSACRA